MGVLNAADFLKGALELWAAVAPCHATQKHTVTNNFVIRVMTEGSDRDEKACRSTERREAMQS